MIYLGNVLEADPVKYDEVWVICRSVEEISDFIEEHDHVFHVPQLAPSKELFIWYRKEFHEGRWGKEAFLKHYVPAFLEMFSEGSEGQLFLEKLAREGKEKDILLVCFCQDEKLCHRSIVGGLLLNMQADIVCDQSYRIYTSV